MVVHRIPRTRKILNERGQMHAGSREFGPLIRIIPEKLRMTERESGRFSPKSGHQLGNNLLDQTDPTVEHTRQDCERSNSARGRTRIGRRAALGF